ncbi:helix-turn-helix domain-containing protein [Cryobacterium melibiosiphilum]|uniref:helix-turn-helix domain-containing protein n=1 Tax=Cryobacterium melibiosiphilum TaxID=995039 RepID=UPI00131467B3|nr:helix-turn-helix domain-containing protein [Cryobacterium melibiosiphilum]
MSNTENQSANRDALAPWPDREKAHGRETTYAPISRIAPTVISPRYLSEDERVHIADALHAGTSLRQTAAALG